MLNRSETLRQLLRKGPVSVRQLTDIMGISQPTVSRSIKALGDEVVRIGSGPSIHYVLRDTHRGFSSAPVYRITEEGQVKSLGKLIPVYPDGFVKIVDLDEIVSCIDSVDCGYAQCLLCQ